MSQKIIGASMLGLVVIAGVIGARSFIVEPHEARTTNIVEPVQANLRSAVEAPLLAARLAPPSDAVVAPTTLAAQAIVPEAGVLAPAQVAAPNRVEATTLPAVSRAVSMNAANRAVVVSPKIALSPPILAQPVQKIIVAQAAPTPTPMTRAAPAPTAAPMPSAQPGKSVAKVPTSTSPVESVIITAPRRVQTANVDIDTIGRGNSLTIQLPRKK